MIILKPFYFIRHGQTDWNAKGRIMGHQDIPLNETGRNQALQAKIHIEKLPITHIYYSPLSRAAQTAHIISEHMQCVKMPLPALKEQHFGEWEGAVLSPEVRDSFNREFPTNSDYVEKTIYNGINHILQNSELPLIVAHGGTYWALRQLLTLPEHDIHNCQLLYLEPPYEEKNSWTVTIIEKNL